MVKQLAAGRDYNEDAIAFSAYVHDFGGYTAFAQSGNDHAAVSAELLPEFLPMYDFSATEQALILEIVKEHHSRQKPESLEAILFHDADAIDFLGYIGVARDLMRCGKDLQKAVGAIRRHRVELPDMLHLETAKKMAQTRIAEIDAFLAGMDMEHTALLTERESI